MADYLTLQHLFNKVGSERVRQFFDDNVDGDLSDDDAAVQQILSEAEGEAASRMLRAYNHDNIVQLAGADEVFVGHVAWVALELASERRPEFCGADGKGQFWAQYERAVSYFENLSKGKQRSRGEAVAGKGKNTGGNLQPKPPAGTADNFVFAPSKSAPDGHGGF